MVTQLPPATTKQKARSNKSQIASKVEVLDSNEFERSMEALSLRLSAIELGENAWMETIGAGDNNPVLRQISSEGRKYRNAINSRTK